MEMKRFQNGCGLMGWHDAQDDNTSIDKSSEQEDPCHQPHNNQHDDTSPPPTPMV
jgi:hypothetical protein